MAMAILGAGRRALTAALGLLAVGVLGQQPGKLQPEQGLPMPFAWCTNKDGCCMQNGHVTLDANWRWYHEVGGNNANCFLDGKWVKPVCNNERQCAFKCALEGLSHDQYRETYGITQVYHGLHMTFTTHGKYGINYGSRVYLTEPGMDRYKIFKLKNREITFTVDASKLGCSMNGALYLVEMPQDGGHSPLNRAGAKYGTGYCDAQCPNDIKFSEKGPNVKHEWGMCCSEVDLWEANSYSTSFSMHPCDAGRVLCKGDASCGYGFHRQSGKCDKDGCDWNPFRLGKHFFYGHGSNRDIDSTKPVTVITQFITTDGTDHGDLKEVRRQYVQGGKHIGNNAAPGISMPHDTSMTDKFCMREKVKFKDPLTFTKKGGLAKLGKAMDRGMVLVMSVWDDEATGMQWLDGTTGSGAGAQRGNCKKIDSHTLRTKYGSSSVTYTNIKYGYIGSTQKGGLGVPSKACSPHARTMMDVLNATQEYATADAQEYAPAEAMDATLGGAVKWLHRPLSLAGLAGVAAVALAALALRVWQASKRSSNGKNAPRGADAAPGQVAETQLLVQ